MSKRLAIRGHSTRGKEVIELLEMMGGKNIHKYEGEANAYSYYLYDYAILNDRLSIMEDDDFEIFTLQEFLEKFPYKVGDVIKFPNNMAEEIAEMKWDEELKDIIYTSVSGCTRPSRVPKNTNKTNMKTDCKKCGLHFGSVRCFDKDCPHNTPKSYAVGLKDGKVIECGVNKEIVMNEIKPLFKTGDVVKLKGCPDKNIFWIVMDVIKDGYIFNDGKKYSFDDQHHYEKSNREVINTHPYIEAPDITAKVTDKNNCDIECPCGYEFYDENGDPIGTKVLMRLKKPKYPTSYADCCDILGFKNRNKTEQQFLNSCDLYDSELMTKLSMLKVCRDAYWKIAGEELQLGKPWKPKFGKYIHYSINFYLYNDSFVLHKGEYSSSDNRILVFPIEEMRDAFYENFKDLIEYCKELL